MNTSPQLRAQLAEEIALSESKLEELEHELEEIGAPATHALRKRLHALRIEEQALQRNFSKAQSSPDDDEVRIRKVETLLHHIEREEASVQHEADFLNLGAPSSVSLAFKGGARLFDLGARGLRRILRDHRPWRSPFVNRSYETIAAEFNLPEEEPTKQEK